MENETGTGHLSIKSFAFLDLETTGLPEFENNKTKITELSIVACSVDHILQTEKNSLPRVLHKLSLCFNPFKRIQLKSTEITGLSNELLEFEEKFNEDSVKIIELFLKNLGNQPVCLIAHNGFKFDFPLLKKAFEKHNRQLNKDLYICDSLEIFQKLNELQNERLRKYKMKEWENQQLKNEIAFDLNDSETGENLNIEDTDQNVESFVEYELERITQEGQVTSTTQNLTASTSFQFKTPTSKMNQQKSELDEDFINFEDFAKQRQIINETTPKRINSDQASFCRPPRKSAIETQINEKPKSLKRELFPSLGEISPITNRPVKGTFTLRNIFFRLHGYFPETSHYAESDVITLLKCAIACKNDFIEMANTLKQSAENVQSIF